MMELSKIGGILLIFQLLNGQHGIELGSNGSEEEEENPFTTENPFKRESSSESKLASCDVFDPFKVLPADSGHFQIGGAFPLHGTDCLKLIPSSVQDVVAVQWALAHWNEQGQRSERNANNKGDTNDRPKLGLFAGDSCSRPKEAIAQTLRFVDSVGYHEPSECLPNRLTGKRNAVLPKLIGVMMPKDRESAESVAQVLRPGTLPIGAFSPASAQALADSNVRKFITTAPLFGDFAKALIELLKLMGSDLISIVDYGEDYAYTAVLQELLRVEGISVAEIIALDHPMLAAILSSSDSTIIVSLVPHKKLREHRLGELGAIRELQKLWIGMELEMDVEKLGENGEESVVDFLPAADKETKQNINLQFVTIRQRRRSLNEFSAYFLRILSSNHAHYTLLKSYVQQVYGCVEIAKGKNCSAELLSPERLAKLHRTSNTIEAAVHLTYALARAAEKVQGNQEQMAKCNQHPSASQCHDAIRAAVLSISPSDRVISGVRVPPGFAPKIGEMHFVETPEGVIQLAGIGIEAVLAEKEGRDEGNIYRLLEYRTGQQSGAEKFALPPKLRHFRSRCRPFRPFCGAHCDQAQQRHDEQTFLSVPQHYSLFIAAMFNLGGPNCAKNKQNAKLNTARKPASIALPLAFVHAMSSFRSRHTYQSSLFNVGGAMDIGPVLVDTCSSGRELLEFLVDSERNCYKFKQAERNWTVAAGATIGYVFGDDYPSQEGILQAMFQAPGTSSLIGIGDKQSTDQPKSPLILQGPTHRATVVALTRFLRRMHWQYVNVVFDRSDASSVSLYKQYERLAGRAGICTADVAIVGEEQQKEEDIQPNESGGDGQQEDAQNRKAKRAEGNANNGGGGAEEEQQKRRFAGVGAPNANVTLVFASAKQAAEYMNARLRDQQMGISGSGGVPVVHVMLGDAHNFHLHDPTNLAQYAGTLSFQPKDVTEPEFREWLQSVTPLALPEAWFWRHVEDRWHCSLFRSTFTQFNGRMCTGEERLDVKGMGRLTGAGYLAKGVHRLLIAIDNSHKKLCSSGEKLCDEFIENGRKLIREMLLKQAKEKADDEFEIHEMVPIDHHGNFDYLLMANLSLSQNPPKSSNDPKRASLLSNLVNFMADYRPFAYGVPVPSATVVSRCRAPLCNCPAMKRLEEFIIDEDADELFGRTSYIRREPARPVDLDQEFALIRDSDDPEVHELGADSLVDVDADWLIRIILLSLSTLLCALSFGTLLMILIKIWRRTIRGSQSLGILLLLGIIGMHASAFLFTSIERSDGGPLICHLRIALPALAHALCIGVIVVKAIQLRNAELLSSIGAAAQQISYWNYWLLLFFIVSVQAVICFRWVLLDSLLWPSSTSASSPTSFAPIIRCSHSSSVFLLAQTYTFFLLFLALLLSAQNRSIKRNYKEAKWLFLTSLVCILIVAGWAACHALVSALHMEYLTVLELHLTGAILLAFVFGPKLYVLLFYEPVVVQYDTNGCAKDMDLFEAEWIPEAVHGGGGGQRVNTSMSPTLSTGSSSVGKNNLPRSANSSVRTAEQRRGQLAEEDDEKVTSAFQTVMRKKTSIGSNGANKVHRTMSGTGSGSGRNAKGSQNLEQTVPKKQLKNNMSR